MPVSVSYRGPYSPSITQRLDAIVDQVNASGLYAGRDYVATISFDPSTLPALYRVNPALSGFTNQNRDITLNPNFDGTRPIEDRFIHELLHVLEPGIARGSPIGYHPLAFYEASERLYGAIGRPFDVKDDVYQTDSDVLRILRGSECFLAGTPILMADGTQKPIEEIKAGDWVMAFDSTKDKGRGPLVPQPVSRTFTSVTRQIIDLHGLKVTPGHRFLTGEGGFETILDILRRDGTIVHKDRGELRARTDLPIGSPGDRRVIVKDTDPATGAVRRLVVRAGIPLYVKDGRVWSLGDMLDQHWLGEILPNGLVRVKGTDAPAHLPDENFLATALQRNFVVEGPDGQPYVPDWIAQIAEDEMAMAVGQSHAAQPRTHAPPGGAGRRPTVVASSGAPLNRTARRKRAALTRIK